MRKTPLILAVALVSVASMCDPSSPSEAERDATTALTTSPRVRLRLSGQLEGYLEPCGCAANQLGGLARRAFKLGEDRDYDMLIEGGNTIATTTALDFDKLLTIQLVLDDSKHPYHALGIAKRDLELDDAAFLSVFEGAAVGLISSDLVKRDLDGMDWTVRPFIERDAREAKIRLASLTIDSPEGFQVLPPKEAWSAAMKGVDPATFRVLMVHAPRDTVEKLAALEPRPDLIVGINGAHPHPPNQPDVIDDVPVVYPGTRGRHLLDVTLARMNGKPTVTRYDPIQLAGSKTAKGALMDPNVVKMLMDHREQVKLSGLREEMAGQLPTFKDYSYVGSEACKECHEDSYKVWEKTKHAHAWTTLEKAEGGPKYPWAITHYPDCVQCHVVGYQEKSGFVNPETTAQLRHVGCEACHGPGSEHVESTDPDDLVPQTIDICLKCHTYEQTPTFTAEVESFWAKIDHYEGNEAQRKNRKKWW